MEQIKQNKNNLVVVIAVAVIAITAAAGVLVYGNRSHSAGQSKLPYAFAKVEQGDFNRQISLTGTVKASQDIQLSFARSGKVAKVGVKAGDGVKAGQVIAELDKADISADYQSAVAGWQSAQANLSAQKLKKQNLLNGAKTEDVAVSETQVASAQKALADAQTAANNVQAQAAASLNTLYAQIDTSLADAYNKSYNTVYNQTDSLFWDGSTNNPRLVFNTPLNNQAKSLVESSRIKAVAAVKQLDSDRQSLAADYSNYADVFQEIEKDLGVVNSYLGDLNNALNYTFATTGNDSAQINADKAMVSGAITTINGSTASLNSLKHSMDLQQKVNQNNISAAQSGVDQAQNALNLANGQLSLKKAGSTAEELGMQDEAIKQAEASLNAAGANVAKAKAQLGDATIIAPIDGVITSVNLDPGEAISANVPVIGLESAGKFQVETYLPELYVGEIVAGQSAKINFDAYGTDRNFDAKVISVDPAAQNVNNTLAYRTLLQFVNEEADIKTGLTANIKIMVADDHNVLSVPESSIIKSADKNFVIAADGRKREVTVGKSSGTGRIEILSGLTVGESVADFGSLGTGR
jgi:HlyD family secretion protein